MKALPKRSLAGRHLNIGTCELNTLATCQRPSLVLGPFPNTWTTCRGRPALHRTCSSSRSCQQSSKNSNTSNNDSDPATAGLHNRPDFANQHRGAFTFIHSPPPNLPKTYHFAGGRVLLMAIYQVSMLTRPFGHVALPGGFNNSMWLGGMGNRPALRWLIGGLLSNNMRTTATGATQIILTSISPPSHTPQGLTRCLPAAQEGQFLLPACALAALANDSRRGCQDHWWAR